MRDTFKRLRTVVMMMTLAIAAYDADAILRAASPNLPSCEAVCSEEPSCDTECETWVGDLIWLTTCGEYGVCPPYCGDGTCNPEIGENYNNCSDCPPPPPPPDPSNIILVNGSFNAFPQWMDVGSAEYNAIAATYGQGPSPWRWMQNESVFFPLYSGIYDGGLELGSFIAALPEGDVQVIAHSHGGNVAIVATFWANRQIKHLINLGTPVNWDVDRYVGGAGTYSRCLISSWDDWTQFYGSSPGQVAAYVINITYAVQTGFEAAQALLDGDYVLFGYLSALSGYYYLQADEWFASAKIEFQGPTYMFGGLSHSDLHEPAVWNAIAPHCALN